CWQSGTATLCARAALQEGGTRASFALDALPFAYFSSFFPEGSRMTGNLGAEGELALLPEAPPRIEVDVTTSRGRIGSEVGGGVAGFAFGRGTGRFAWDGGLMEIGLDWPFEREQGRLELGAVIEQSPDGSFADSRIDGNFF